MGQFKRAAFYTLGCKLNFAETSTIARGIVDYGYARVEFDQPAEIYVINTCSVTENSDKKCKQLVKKALQTNPNGKVIIVGCYAQLKPQEISEIPGVSLVLGANEKFNVKDYLEKLESANQEKIVANEIKTTRTFVPGYSIGDRTRSFLKVQDGCDYFCSFCTIPLARGRSRSANVQDTIRQAKELANKETKEVVLTGVNIGDYGREYNESFLDLIKELDKIKGIERFRISSIEPNLLHDEIIEFVAKSQRFVPHFHIPLQSGSDALLQNMRRRYNSDLYRNRIQKIIDLMPNCSIGADVIVGFPGETDELFQTTFDFINELPVSYLHVFTYSERNNTTAVRMENSVPMATRKLRSKMLRILSEKKKRAFYESNVGLNEKVLLEGEESEGLMYGFTNNYIKIQTPFNPLMANQTVAVEMMGINKSGNMNCKFINQVVEQNVIVK